MVGTMYTGARVVSVGTENQGWVGGVDRGLGMGGGGRQRVRDGWLVS